MSGSAPRKILVVDDEPDVVTYLGTFLEDNGYQVISAEDGKEGLAKAVAEHPDLILLDITMPTESGVRMYRELHASPATRNIPVIMVTGVSPEFERFIETRRQVPPPAGYFEKPPDRGKLLARIEELLAPRG